MSSTSTIIRAAIVMSAFMAAAPAFAHVAASATGEPARLTASVEGLELARKGADDGAGHRRRGGEHKRNHASATESGLMQVARRGADDGAGHVRHGGGRDDRPGDTRRGRGRDDAPGDDRGRRG